MVSVVEILRVLHEKQGLDHAAWLIPGLLMAQFPFY